MNGTTTDATTHEEDEEEEIRKLVRRARENIADTVSLSSITKLDLLDCGLSQLPDAFATALPNLSVLFLSKNNFTEMPAIIGKCRNLQMVAFKSNHMTSIHPDALQSQLRWLILTDNQLSTIPDTIGRCTKLQKCMLSGNQITQLPCANVIAKLTKLELIRLASNRLTEPPLALLQLPNLCWVALSDNPFLVTNGTVQNGDAKNTTTALLLPTIITDLKSDEIEKTGEVLGQGAGGVTRKVWYQGRPVAVKTYCGHMTSDGLPETERQISCAASLLDCDALIQVHGECQDSGALVMEFLDKYTALADPPSLESCSRDVYSADTVLSWEEASAIVTKLLDALVHLHNNNNNNNNKSSSIMHGDFYAHNILVCRDNLQAVRLSDFGAAFFYDPTADYAKLLQTIELRAYAVFVDEVAEQLLNETNQKVKLADLAAACRKTRATFAQVQIYWQQKLLADMAKAFDVED